MIPILQTFHSLFRYLPDASLHYLLVVDWPIYSTNITYFLCTRSCDGLWGAAVTSGAQPLLCGPAGTQDRRQKKPHSMAEWPEGPRDKSQESGWRVLASRWASGSRDGGAGVWSGPQRRDRFWCIRGGMCSRQKGGSGAARGLIDLGGLILEVEEVENYLCSFNIHTFSH